MKRKVGIGVGCTFKNCAVAGRHEAGHAQHQADQGRVKGGIEVSESPYIG